MTDEFDPQDEKPSKTQKKREMDALRSLANRLTELTSEQLGRIPDQQIRDAVTAAKKISKGNARKRQIQYTAKLMSKTDVSDIRTIVDELDASSSAYVQKFHQLETWRERLIHDDPEVHSDIFALHPDCDRQQLGHLTRSAKKESQAGLQGTQFRKLFQFLKSLQND